MNTTMPPGFWLAFVGAVVLGGLALWMAFRVLSRIRFKERLRAAATDAGGSAAVETMFALVVFFTITIYAWQFTFICAAYQVVDYASYAAARCAIVVVPTDLSAKGGKPANEVEEDLSGPSGSLWGEDDGIPTSKAAVKDKLKEKAAEVKCAILGYALANKRRDVEGAAQWVCYPISGFKQFEGIDLGIDLGGAFDLSAGASLRGPKFLRDFVNKHDFLKRYFYARAHTRAEFVPESTSFASADTITVKVTHDFSLRVPFASILFRNGHDPDDGSYRTLVSVTTLPFDPGEEFAPTATPGDADGLARAKK